MAKTKFVVNVAVTIVYPDGFRTTRREVAQYVRDKLESDIPLHYKLTVAKAVVRDVDLD